MLLKTSIIGGFVAAFFSGSAFAQTPQLSENEVRIGVLNDMSGVFADASGAGSVLAAQMAVEDFKAEIKPEFSISVVKADHQNKPDIASSIARGWYDVDKVDMIVDVPTSSAALAVLKVAREKNRVAIISGGAAPNITGEDCTPTVLHWTYDTYSAAATTAKAVLKEGGDSWFFITADYLGGQSLEKDGTAAVKAGGGKIVGTVRHPFPGRDFSSQLVTAQSSGAKVVGLANAGSDTINSIKQAAEFDLTRQQKLAAMLLFITDVDAIGLNDAQNLYLTEGFYWNFDDKTRAWSKRFFAKQKRMPSMVQAGVYSAVLNYLRGVQAAGSDEAMRVVEAMRRIPIEDMFSRNGKLRDDGRMVHDMYLLQVKKPEESKEPWDYYHVRQVVPGEQAFRPLADGKCPHVKTPG